jgi:hypothetical protein
MSSLKQHSSLVDSKGLGQAAKCKSIGGLGSGRYGLKSKFGKQLQEMYYDVTIFA